MAEGMLDVKNSLGKSALLFYYIGEIDGRDIFLTQIESLCLLAFFRHSKLSVASEVLGLRIDSVEFHIANIREKLHCRDLQEIFRHPALTHLKKSCVTFS